MWIVHWHKTSSLVSLKPLIKLKTRIWYFCQDGCPLELNCSVAVNSRCLFNILRCSCEWSIYVSLTLLFILVTSASRPCCCRTKKKRFRWDSISLFNFVVNTWLKMCCWVLVVPDSSSRTSRIYAGRGLEQKGWGAQILFFKASVISLNAAWLYWWRMRDGRAFH